MAQTPKIVYGAFTLTLLSKDEGSKVIELLKENGVTEWDTARIYPNSEKTIGELGLAKDIIIDTKARGFFEGSLSKEEIFESIKQSLDELKVLSVDTFYLHSPDPKTPIEETIDAIGVLHKQGKFRRFGLSNYSTEDVKKIYDYAKSKGYVLPTVFQGNYNAFSRSIEKELFPLLRQLRISFYAYSPAAGGFLTKSAQQIEQGDGRFKKETLVGKLYNKLYNRPALLKGLDDWGGIAEKHKISRAHLAYRWLAFHSSLSAKEGDAIIVGGKNPEQIADTLHALKEGPLPDDVVLKIDEIWSDIKNEAPVNNYIY